VKPELWKHGIAADPDRIRLAGKRVLSIDAMRPSRVPYDEPEFRRTFDWRRVATEASLSRLETQLLQLHWRDGVPVATCHQQMGVTCHEVERAYRSVIQKLRMGSAAVQGAVDTAPARDSRRIVYRDRLSGGARPWALASLGGPFREIMEREKKYITFIPQQDRRIARPNIDFCARQIGAHMNALEMETKLRGERVDLDKLVVEGQGIAAEIRRHESDLEKLRVAAPEVLVTADYSKRVAASEKLLGEALAREKSFGCKLARQRAIVEASQHEIESNRFSLFAQQLAPAKSEFLEAVETLMRSAVKIGVIFDKYQITGSRMSETGIIFDPHNPADPGEREMDRQLAATLLGVGLEMHRHRGLRGYAEKISA
jgi:hypothetical protein